jgi:hypothetical protein
VASVTAAQVSDSPEGTTTILQQQLFEYWDNQGQGADCYSNVPSVSPCDCVHKPESMQRNLLVNIACGFTVRGYCVNDISRPELIRTRLFYSICLLECASTPCLLVTTAPTTHSSQSTSARQFCRKNYVRLAIVHSWFKSSDQVSDNLLSALKYMSFQLEQLRQ